jgi:hypothetical protein
MKKNSQDWKSRARLSKKQNEEGVSEQEQIEILQLELKQALKENAVLINEINKLKEQQGTKTKTAALAAVKEQNTIDLAGYDVSWTWLNKLIFILKRANKPMQSKEILKLLESIDKSLKYFDDKQKVLSVHLNKAVKYERIKHYKIRGSGGFFYCLPEWFEGDSLKSLYTKKINPL